jgi:hypothetical protein
VLMPKALKISHSSIRREATRRSVERRTES